jgi:uncharacterized membrane protein YkoI
MSKRIKYVSVVLGGLCFAFVAMHPPPLLADHRRGGNHDGEDRDHDHDRALEAVQRGEVMPLEQVLMAVRAKIEGVVVRTKLEQENGGWVYELKVLDRDGRMREINVNAKTGELLNPEDH